MDLGERKNEVVTGRKRSDLTVRKHNHAPDSKLYLILVLLSPLHLRWGVGQVFWTLVKLVFHGLDGMAAGMRNNVCVKQ